MAITVQPILSPQAASVADGASLTPVTNGITKENSFYSALQSLLLNGASTAPVPGKTVLPAAGKDGKTGQKSPEGGNDLPLVLVAEAAPTTIGSVAPAEITPAAGSAVSAEMTQVVGSTLPVVVNDTGSLVQDAPAPASLASTISMANTGVTIASTTNTLVAKLGQEGETLSMAESLKATTQGESQPAFISSSNARRESNLASSADAPRNEKGGNSVGASASAESDDAMTTMLNKIIQGREVISATSGQGVSVASPAVVRDSASPVQQFLTQPLADLTASARGVAPHSTPVTTNTSLAVPFNQPGWGQALGERVNWMVTQRIQAAEIHLNPPELGPVEVRLSMEHDQTRIQFLSPHASVREAIEAALPRLREMLADGSNQLVNVNVGQHSADRQSHFQAGFGDAQRNPALWPPGTSGEDDVILSAGTTAIPALGLVDYYV